MFITLYCTFPRGFVSGPLYVEQSSLSLKDLPIYTWLMDSFRIANYIIVVVDVFKTVLYLSLDDYMLSHFHCL